MEKKKKTEKKDFESSLRELEDIAYKLESGELGLEESIKEYEKGMKLAQYCHKKLEEAERKIEILQKDNSGQITAAEVRVTPDTGEIEDDEEVQGSLL